jgi:hypothetical protein
MIIGLMRRAGMLVLLGNIALCTAVRAQQAAPPALQRTSAILITNVRLFDGVSD